MLQSKFFLSSTFSLLFLNVQVMNTPHLAVNPSICYWGFAISKEIADYTRQRKILTFDRNQTHGLRFNGRRFFVFIINGFL